MRRPPRLTCVFVFAGVLLAGCTGGETPPPATVDSSPVRVVVPGKPGESAKVTDSDQVRAPEGSTYNQIDVTFAQMMIVHHGQALEMAALAPQRAGNATLRALAERISAAQKPEQQFLRGWLQARKQPESAAGHDHGTMPGMQSAADLAALAATSGADFDRRFVAMMTAHHEGALKMAADVVRGGNDQQLREVAHEMSIEQGSEISRLRDIKI